jgi:hypothetical protein
VTQGVEDKLHLEFLLLGSVPEYVPDVWTDRGPVNLAGTERVQLGCRSTWFCSGQPGVQAKAVVLGHSLPLPVYSIALKLEGLLDHHLIGRTDERDHLEQWLGERVVPAWREIALDTASQYEGSALSYGVNHQHSLVAVRSYASFVSCLSSAIIWLPRG